MEINVKELMIKKNATVAFRLHEKVKEALAEAAAAKNMTMAEYCEKLVMRELKREGVTISATVNLI